MLEKYPASPLREPTPGANHSRRAVRSTLGFAPPSASTSSVLPFGTLAVAVATPEQQRCVHRPGVHLELR